jgi:hypothetical protein
MSDVIGPFAVAGIQPASPLRSSQRAHKLIPRCKDTRQKTAV